MDKRPRLTVRGHGQSSTPGGRSISDLIAESGCADLPDVVSVTNAYRARHRAPNLAWSSLLANGSLAYAKVLAKKCDSYHSSGKTYGENLMLIKRYPSPQKWDGCVSAINAWYSEVQNFDFEAELPYSDNDLAATGHFTQLVWRSTTYFGCGMAGDNVEMPFYNGVMVTWGCKMVVCRFVRPGNYMSDMEFLKNASSSLSFIFSDRFGADNITIYIADRRWAARHTEQKSKMRRLWRRACARGKGGIKQHVYSKAAIYVYIYLYTTVWGRLSATYIPPRFVTCSPHLTVTLEQHDGNNEFFGTCTCTTSAQIFLIVPKKGSWAGPLLLKICYVGRLLFELGVVWRQSPLSKRLRAAIAK
ncbi:hypothetical protein VOLCADRAFT_102802 [Volvox carteri f. nagariensis]|uniref:SCP domain-containing protein n=1 Tax=Volvox carteri f. nagariensis TaxID=3068 RepID=D8TI80_VOLCA|nr:uncharacterized protein VOLCADRAFT_102802 [Volvox carteri f. nagariensis]EFJ52849.1 hypothetical protein VOLCADRAFT_102802 [Volvox carteri f. nagariensis]|eukprot:XP_002945854.1 hypothetical protein VOLCADRAFT_102802 [Volvox carteri f. nagariensis]